MNTYDIRSAIRSHLALTKGTYFQNIIDINGATIAYGNVPSVYWNIATLIDTEKENLPTLVKETTQILTDLGKYPSFSLEPTTTPRKKLSSYLQNMGFNSFRVLWMFYKYGNELDISIKKGLKLLRVTTTQGMLDFIKVFNKSHKNINPAYGQALFAGYLNPNPCLDIHYFVGYIEDKPVSIASYFSALGYGGIYNVATIPEFRNQGLATALISKCISISLENQDKMLFLQCKEQQEKFYHLIGFFAEFTERILYKT